MLPVVMSDFLKAVFKKTLVGFYLTFCCHLAEAADDSLRRLIAVSGVGTQLNVMSEMIKTSFNQEVRNGGLSLNAQQVQAIQSAFDQAFAPAKLKIMMEASLQGRITSKEILPVIAFFEMPLGQRIVALEARLARTDVQLEIKENAAKIMANLAKNSARMALYASLDGATESTLHAVEVHIGAVLAMNAAVMTAAPKSYHGPSLPQLQETLESQRFAITSVMAQAVLSQMAYAYQSLTDAHLNQYLEFALSQNGKRYFKAMGDAFVAMMAACAYDVGKIIQTQSNRKTT